MNKLNEIPAKPIKSGVKLAGYNKLNFSNHHWQETPTLKSTKLVGGKEKVEWEYSSDELISMVNIVVKVTELDAYLLKNKFGIVREVYPNKIAIFEKMFNDYQNDPYPSQNKSALYKLDVNKISLLVYGKHFKVVNTATGPEQIEVPCGTIPSVYATVDYPMHGEFMCTDKGEFILNLGCNYKTVESKNNPIKAGHFLRMVYRNLCDYPKLTGAKGKELSVIEEGAVLFEKVLTNTFTDDEKDFKFVMSWLSAIVQNPGINLMTNIWFAGAYQGIGKGTLVTFMKYILGPERAALLKPNMITGSFNQPLDNKFILEINEKQHGVTPLMMTNWLKSFSQEDTIQIEGKGDNPFTRRNMINVIGTAQTPEDVFKIEDEDRRNVIYQTVSQDGDEELVHRKYAKFLAESLKNDTGWGEAVAWVLERVEVDWNLISTAYKTRSYAEIKSTQTASKNPLYYWAQTQFVIYKKLKKDVKTSVMRDEYLEKNRNMSAGVFNKFIKELQGVQGIVPFKLAKPCNILTAKFNFDEVDELTAPDIFYKVD